MLSSITPSFSLIAVISISMHMPRCKPQKNKRGRKSNWSDPFDSSGSSAGHHNLGPNSQQSPGRSEGEEYLILPEPSDRRGCPRTSLLFLDQESLNTCLTAPSKLLPSKHGGKGTRPGPISQKGTSLGILSASQDLLNKGEADRSPVPTRLIQVHFQSHVTACQAFPAAALRTSFVL